MKVELRSGGSMEVNYIYIEKATYRCCRGKCKGMRWEGGNERLVAGSEKMKQHTMLRGYVFIHWEGLTSKN